MTKQNKLKILLLSLMLILLTTTVSAGMMDKQLMTIENCYNLTVHYELTDGVTTPINFKDCTDKGNSTYFCNCRRDEGVYNLIMQTDNAIIRDAREYEISVTGYTYSFYKDKENFKVLDWGDYIDNKNKHPRDFGQDSTTCDSGEIEYVYVNQTIETIVNKTIEVPVEVFKEKIVERNITIQVDNTTMITTLKNQRNNSRLFMILFLIISLGLGYALFRIWWKK